MPSVVTPTYRSASAGKSIFARYLQLGAGRYFGKGPVGDVSSGIVQLANLSRVYLCPATELVCHPRARESILALLVQSIGAKLGIRRRCF